MTDLERRELRERYQAEYKELTGRILVCLERKNRLTHYRGVARKHLLSIASEYSGISPERLVSVNRARELVTVRQMMCYLLREMKITFVEMGIMFGQDHTTIINAINVLRGHIQVDSSFKLEYQEFKSYCLEHLDEFKQKKQKIDEHQRKAIRESYKSGQITQIELAEIYDVNKTTIYRICK